jgi:hypothetical protein
VLVGEDEVIARGAVVRLDDGVGRGGHSVECRTSYFLLQAGKIPCNHPIFGIAMRSPCV